MDQIMDEVNDLKELWETDLEMNESLRLTPADMPDWFMDSGHSAGDNKIPHVILNDKLMTDALLGTAPIKTEHSYSLTSDGVSIPHSNSDDLKNSCISYAHKDNNQGNNRYMQQFNSIASCSNVFAAVSPKSGIFNAIQAKGLSDSESSSSSSSEYDENPAMKKEPLSPHSSCPPSPSNLHYLPSIPVNSELFEGRKPQTLMKDHNFISSQIKMEHPLSNLVIYPPSPESKGNSSPEHSLTTSISPSFTNASKKLQQNSTFATRSFTNSTRQPIHTPLISNQPKGSTGDLFLTDEEKRTLLAEGYPIPQRLPLTKAEEKSLKKIRRKIKNKISAQESRRKKKEYMDQLERRVEKLVAENNSFRQKVKSLSDENSNLLKELQQLLFTNFPKNQSLVISRNTKRLLRTDLEVDSCLE